MTPEHERASLMLSRANAWAEDGVIDAAQRKTIAERFSHPWRIHGLVVQAVFFSLTCVALLATYGLIHVFGFPGPGLLAGAGAIAIAEVLIRRKRWFATGVEAALWLGGLFAMISELPRTGTPESLLVLAAAAAVAGIRVKNPFFGMLAVGLVVAWGEQRFDFGTVVALLFGIGAMVALTRTWRRPSAELFFAGTSILMPFAGRVAADERWRSMTIAIYAVWGLIALVLAIRERHHALFLTSAVALVICAIDVAARITLADEAKLAGGGVGLLALSWMIGRALRGKTSGIVATPAKLTGFDEALEVAGALAAAEVSRAGAPQSDGRPQGDGSFGGAGATGDF